MEQNYYLLGTRVDKVLVDCLQARFFNLFPHVKTRPVHFHRERLKMRNKLCTGPVQDVQRQMSLKVLHHILSRCPCFGVPRTDLGKAGRRDHVPGEYRTQISFLQRVLFDSCTARSVIKASLTQVWGGIPDSFEMRGKPGAGASANAVASKTFSQLTHTEKCEQCALLTFEKLCTAFDLLGQVEEHRRTFVSNHAPSLAAFKGGAPVQPNEWGASFLLGLHIRNFEADTGSHCDTFIDVFVMSMLKTYAVNMECMGGNPVVYVCSRVCVRPGASVMVRMCLLALACLHSHVRSCVS